MPPNTNSNAPSTKSQPPAKCRRILLLAAMMRVSTGQEPTSFEHDFSSHFGHQLAVAFSDRRAILARVKHGNRPDQLRGGFSHGATHLFGLGFQRSQGTRDPLLYARGKRRRTSVGHASRPRHWTRRLVVSACS